MPSQFPPTFLSAPRDAATLVLIRHDLGDPHVLLGRRRPQASFMPSRVVFPGGVVDAGDAAVALARPLPDTTQRRLGPQAPALAVAAIRELWEETGLALGHPAAWPDVPADWHGFARQGSAPGLRPDAAPLQFIFRAVTPPSYPRRFDARFFLADTAELGCDLDDFSHAEGELCDLAWVPLHQTETLDLPFITMVALAEVRARLQQANGADHSRPVPFLTQTGPTPIVQWLD